MSDLLTDPKLTPKRFASYFEDFDFDLHPFDVQDPDVFLGDEERAIASITP